MDSSDGPFTSRMDKVILEILDKYLKISNTKAHITVVCEFHTSRGSQRSRLDWLCEQDLIFGFLTARNEVAAR